MASYNYIARDSSGTRKEGIRYAGSLNDVLGWLREQGFTPISVNEMSEAIKQTKPIARKKRIKCGDLAALCWQLATMTEAGIPITAALETIGEDIENAQLRETLQHILEKMLKGETLSDSISEFPKVFDSLSRAIVLAGETGGSLPGALRRLAEYFDGKDEFAKKIKGAMIYPAFVFVFIVLMVVFIMTFIIPRFSVIFDQLGGELPAFTRAFMGFYDAVRLNLVYIIGTLAVTIVLGILCFKTAKGHYLFSKITLELPVLRKLLAQSFIVIFCKTMATLLAEGVSVLEVFDILSTMTDNEIIKNAIVQTKANIVGGSNISRGLAKAGFFPNIVVKMIQIGEESGSLSSMLERTADYYERKVDTTVNALMSLLEPVMILTTGAIVLVVVLALYLPIFSMSG